MGARRWMTARAALGVCLLAACALPSRPDAPARRLQTRPGWEALRTHIIPVQPPSTAQVDAAALSPDGNYVAVDITWGVPAGQTGGTIFQQLQLWDVDRGAQLKSTMLASEPIGAPRLFRLGSYDRFLRFTSDEKRLVVFDTRDLDVFELPSLRLLRKLDLHLPIIPAKDLVSACVNDVEVSPGGNRVAVSLTGNSSGGSVLIYDLSTGALERRWTYGGIPVYPQGRRLAWSPNGDYIAATVYPRIPGQRLPRDAKTLLVFDAHSGALLRDFHTPYVAGPVAFATNSLLLTASVERASGRHRGDTIQEWNIQTGELVREFKSSPDGPRSQLATSRDGRVLAGYIPTQDVAQGFVLDATRRFELWDLATGAPLFVSAPLPAPPRGQGIAAGFTRLDIDGQGTRVLIWMPGSGQPLLVYDLSPGD